LWGDDVATQDSESISEAADPSQAARLIDAYLRELESAKLHLLNRTDIKSFPTFRAILELSSDGQLAVVMAAVARQTDVMRRFGTSGGTYGVFSLNRIAGFKQLISILLRKHLPFRLEHVNRLVGLLAGARGYYAWQLSLAGILRVVENFCRETGIPDSLRPRLVDLKDKLQAQPEHAETRDAVKRLDQLLTPAPAAAPGSLLATGEAWTRYLRGQLDGLEPPALPAWQALLLHCDTASQSKPSRKWLQQAGGLVAEIGPAAFTSVLKGALAEIGKPGTPQIK